MKKTVSISSDRRHGDARGFTIVEMIVGICIAIVLVGGIGILINTLEDNLSSVGFLEQTITEKEDWERDLRDLTRQYDKILVESGTIFTKTNIGFENMVYTNTAETGGIMIGAIDHDADSIMIGNDYSYRRYHPLIAILSAAEITMAKSDYPGFIASFPGKKKIYRNLPIISLAHYILNNGGEKYDMNFTLLFYKELSGKDLYEIYSNKDSRIFSTSLVR